MKNLLTFCISVSVLLFGGLACKNNPLAKYTKQYHCTIEGEPEPQTSEEYFNRAAKHNRNESPENSSSLSECAFAALNEAIRLDPNNVKALRMRGYGYRGKHEYDLALADLDKAIQIEPNNPDIYWMRGRVYEEKGLIDKALEDQTTIIDLLLKNNPADNQELIKELERRAELYEKNTDYENAIKDYSELIRLKPDYETLYVYLRAKAFEKKGDYENAVKDYSELIRLKPADEDNYYQRAEVYKKLGKNDLAEADEQKFWELNSAKKGKTSSSIKTVSGGVLNDKATNLVQPTYPMAARAVRASGAVNVQVTIDENGNVTSASALTGHLLLRQSAESAARALKFRPTMLSGQKVKVAGIVVYKFVAE